MWHTALKPARSCLREEEATLAKQAMPQCCTHIFHRGTSHREVSRRRTRVHMMVSNPIHKLDKLGHIVHTLIQKKRSANLPFSCACQVKISVRGGSKTAAQSTQMMCAIGRLARTSSPDPNQINQRVERQFLPTSPRFQQSKSARAAF